MTETHDSHLTQNYLFQKSEIVTTYLSHIIRQTYPSLFQDEEMLTPRRFYSKDDVHKFYSGYGKYDEKLGSLLELL